ncbi:MAG: (d)CMP kinase [Planctomycetaceae bacterium]|nr:(d)CMP kinase [Planctomycetaceae bacterium]
MKPLIITIDGPAGTGKSTAAKLLASRLEIPFLDTGAMYRAVAWRCLRNNIAFDDEKLVAFQTQTLQFDFSNSHLLIDGADPGEELRTQEVSEAASVIATLQTVRNLLVDQQRKLAGVYSLVTEGRDQGTVVFPNATCKFFLTATAQTRAQRRWMDLQKTDPAASKEVILKEIQQRDERDRNRKAAPLKPAADAIVIDNSEKSLEQVAALLVEHVKQATASEA